MVLKLSVKYEHFAGKFVIFIIFYNTPLM